MQEEQKRMKEKNKKLIKNIIVIFIIFILLIILYFLFNNFYIKLINNKEFENSIISFTEKNQKTIFSINKIIFFSSSDSKNKLGSTTNFTIENLYTYTDIALFINNNSEENSEENILKSVKITNIKFTKEAKCGKANLYYKSVNDFAKSEIEEENLIENELQFETTSEDEADLSKPILYNNCANPITISYINQNIKTDYTMTDTQNPITYNGKLLNRCGVSIDSINASISFDIEIENEKNQKFRTTVYFDIPYEDEEKSIYDGSLTVKKETNFNFYRYE
jgi:hypothetical protein